MPEYYKTKKGYYYKKTQKGGSTRISKDNYEKAVKRQEGGFLFKKKSNPQQSPKDVYNSLYRNKSIHEQYYMRYSKPEDYKKFRNENYNWKDEFYILNASHILYFQNLLNTNNNDSIRRNTLYIKNMIYSRYLKIIYTSSSFPDFQDLLNKDDLFMNHPEYKESLVLTLNQYNNIKKLIEKDILKEGSFYNQQ